MFDSNNTQRIHPTEQLARIVELLEKIEQRANPPAWKQIIKFFFVHFFSILALAFLAYATWKIWGTVSNMQDIITNILNALGNMQSSIGSVFERGSALFDF